MDFTKQNYSIPDELKSYIQGERVLFSRKAKYFHNRGTIKFYYIFSLMWIIISSIIFAIFWAPLISSGSTSFLLNKRRVVATWDNLNPLLFPSIILILLFIVGLIILVYAIIASRKPGALFVGTEKNLISYLNEIKSYEWHNFNGVINFNPKNQTILLELKTFKVIKTRNNRHNTTQQQVNDFVEMIQIDNPQEVLSICKNKIVE